MKYLFSKLMSSFVIVFVIFFAVGCSPDNKEQNSSVDTELQQTENSSAEEDTTNEDNNSEESLLTGTYKVARQNIYVDTPPFNRIEEGYTMIYRDGNRKYATFTCVKKVSVDSLSDAHDILIEKFQRNVLPQHQINEIDNIQIVETKINDIDTLNFEGTCNAGHNPIYDAYIYGYSFMYEELPCAIIGVVDHESQSESEKELVKQIVDEMMTTVRNSR